MKICKVIQARNISYKMMVRVWEIRPQKQTLLAVLKEHKGPVSSIDISHTDKEAVTASTDGTCIIWDIERYARQAILFSSTLFMCVRYHPSSCQVITCGTNRQIGYWEVFDGSLIREVEGSSSSALNTLDITSDGMHFATGGSDQVLKIWKYKEGVTTHIGLGHAGVITTVRFSPDYSTIVSASADGAIFIWECPVSEQPPKTPPTRESIVSRSTCSLRDEKTKKTENIAAISPTQSVRAGSESGKSKPLSASSVVSGGSVKCYCTSACKCKADEISIPPSTPRSGNRSTPPSQGINIGEGDAK